MEGQKMLLFETKFDEIEASAIELVETGRQNYSVFFYFLEPNLNFKPDVNPSVFTIGFYFVSF